MIKRNTLMVLILLSTGLWYQVQGLSAKENIETIDYFVSPGGNDSWSGKLSAPNSEKKDGPFRTLHRARDAVRELKAKGGFNKPVRIIVREGTYYLAEKITLGPEDSGIEKCPIVYTAYPGEKVILSGGKPITGPWKTDDGKIYYADIPEAKEGKWKFRQLFVDGSREIQARYPNYDPGDILKKGWLFVPEIKEGLGIILAGLAKKGDWVEYEFNIPKTGEYLLWAGYATTLNSMEKNLSLSIDDKNIPLEEMPPSGEGTSLSTWRKVIWTKVATLKLERGKHVMRLENVSSADQRIHFDAFVFTDNPELRPDWRKLERVPAEGENRIIVQAEAKKDGSSSVLQFQTFICPGYGPQKSFYIIPVQKDTIREGWVKAQGAEIHIFAAWGWFNEIVQMTSIDTEKSIIKIKGRECQGDIRPGNRFFISNVLEELDEPGEWYLDSNAGRLYYWPRKTPIDSSTVIAPVLDKIFHLYANVNGNERVKYITIRDFEFTHTDYKPDHAAVRTAHDGTIVLENAYNCTIENCNFTNIGGYGVWLHLDSCDNKIIGNTVTLAGAGGVLLTAAVVDRNSILTAGETASKYAPIRNTISHNYIHHSGLIYKYISGVHLDSRPENMIGEPGNLVSYNTIHDMPRLGIFAFVNQGGNVFEYNHIYNVCLESDDAGAIHINSNESLKCLTSLTIIRNNLIHDVFGPRFDYSGNVKRMFGFGIYLDGATSNCSISNNVIYRTSYGTVFVHGGKNNIVENNILVNDAAWQFWMDDYAGIMSDNKFRRNIVYCTNPEADFIVLRPFNKNEKMLAESDYNLFWRADKPVEIALDRQGWKPASILSFSEWQNKGFDVHSVVADPLFVNPEKDDYSLKPQSPAFKLGFVGGK